MNIQFIYALHAEDDPETYYYIGRSADPERRLKEHVKESKSGDTAKCEWIASVIENGQQVCHKILKTIVGNDSYNWESEFLDNLGQTHPLTNSTGGSAAPHITDPSKPKAKYIPWSAELFHDADWSKNFIGAKRNEKGVHIRGIRFFRRGKSKLRLIHPYYGAHDCPGWDHAKKIERAVEMMTPDTDANIFMREQYARRQRLGFK